MRFLAVPVTLCFDAGRRDFLIVVMPTFGVGIFVLNFWLGMIAFTISGMIGGAGPTAMSIMGGSHLVFITSAVSGLMLGFQAENYRKADAENDQTEN
jgi:hypothetical protein